MYIATWSPGCRDHSNSDCRCTLTVSWPNYPIIAPIVVPRVLNHRLLTYNYQNWHVFRTVIEKYVLDDGVPILRPSNRVVEENVMHAAYQYFTTTSNIMIPPPFIYKNMPIPYLMPDIDRLREGIMKVDRAFLRYAGVDTRPDDYNLDYRNTPMSLRLQLLRRISLYHTYYGDFGGFRAVVNTLKNIDSVKMIKLFSEFSNDGIGRAFFSDIQRLMPRALKLVSKFLDNEKHYGKVRFNYNPRMLCKFVTNPMSSAGIRPGYVKKSVVNGVPVVETPIGKKVDSFPYYAHWFNEFMKEVHITGLGFTNLYQRWEAFCVIRLKQEFKFCYPADAVKAAELLDKCREFFIPNMFLQFLSKLLMSPKQKLERGDVIKIGHRWNHGGAQRLALHLNVYTPGVIWHTGDFKKLDKSMRDWLLGLYVASGRPYFEKRGDWTDVFLRDLFIILAERINVKLVCHIGGVWTMMKAFMYSGGFETSHGDSWGVLLAFCLYLIHTIDRYPVHADNIVACFNTLIKIVVYGDDHVWSAPSRYRHILNEKLFGAFVNKYMGMTIRDVETHEVFFSTTFPNGELKHAGVVFLKRYFIEKPLVNASGFPLIYPFKPTHETMLKLFCNKDGVPSTYLHQCVGQIYDTFGTNPVSYNLVTVFYRHWCEVLKIDPLTALAQALENLDYMEIKRYQNKYGLTLDQMKKGLPPINMLLKNHKIDYEKENNFKQSYETVDIYGLDVTEFPGDYL